MAEISCIVSTRDARWRQVEVAPSAHQPNLVIGAGRHQRVDGFGGCFNELGWLALRQLGPDDRQAVLNALFDPDGGCRFRFCRVPIGASDYGAEWYSHNETPGDFTMEHFSIARDEQVLVPYIQAAQAIQPKLELFASPWSPPTWMKFPRAYNYGKLIWEPAILQAYARYFVMFVQAYAAQGIPVRQIHPQNEPVADQKFPSCVWTGAQLRDFVADYLAPALAEAGLDTEIWLGTLNTDDYDQYVSLVLSDPKAAAAIAGVGFQWAGKGAIQRTHESFPGKRLMQTENECGDGLNTWEYAHYVFGLIRHYFANGANAYIYWNMVLQPGGLSTWGWRQNAMVTVDPEARTYQFNPEFYVMKHLTGFVDEGARRCALEGALTGNALAFENPDGSRVVVAANPLAEARELVLNAGGETVSIELPGESFVTLAVTG